MSEPATAAGVHEFHRLAQTDPQQALATASRWIAENPSSATAYFSRHQVWLRLGEPQRAISDLNTSIELDPTPTDYRARGDIYRHIGEYKRAIEDYQRGESIAPDEWQADVLPMLYQADTYARLGDERMALAYCARLPNDIWTPGHNDLPSGSKTEIAAELRRRAAAAMPTEGDAPPSGA